MPDDVPDLEDLRRVARRARQAATELADTGGVVSLADLPERWGVTRSTVRVYVDRPDFPQPWQTIGERKIWLAADVDLWRSTPRLTGRPPKRADAD